MRQNCSIAHNNHIIGFDDSVSWKQRTNHHLSIIYIYLLGTNIAPEKWRLKEGVFPFVQVQSQTWLIGTNFQACLWQSRLAFRWNKGTMKSGEIELASWLWFRQPDWGKNVSNSYAVPNYICLYVIPIVYTIAYLFLRSLHTHKYIYIYCMCILYTQIGLNSK